MKHFFCFLALSAGLLSPAHAITIPYNFNSGFQNGGALPDGNPTGIADLRSIVTPITSIDAVAVGINISGGWNGDIYATLQHDSGFAVLLNRVGRTSDTGLGAFGFSDDGFAVTFNDAGIFPDIHTSPSGGGGQLSGTFSSDGREVDPDDVLDSDPRTALLTSFNGLDPNGDWTLFVADMVGGDQHVLTSWSLEITGQEGADVPDGGSSAMMLTLALASLVSLRHARRKFAA